MPAASDCWQAAKPTLLKHYLPLGLGMALFLGLTVPAAGAAVAKPKVAGRGAVSFVCVMLIFIISGLTLKTDDVKKALQAWKATVFGFVSRARNESMALRAKGRAPRCAHGRMHVPGDRVIPIYFGAQPHGRG